ncbi:ABC transporter permease [Streptacidiphilus sp. ASG 303]|uniref:ABC transporter permease n=1 Tax=Streptacidiphilus sp. ASG 303 TaxID=2896847 RepID=UPI001E536556|nr:ABC transporter permease [Streptacidiphilus sp. ASG 303]MCD0482783.1 ABC transporter permease [Streptacidiphilus sp. ASG 303]
MTDDRTGVRGPADGAAPDGTAPDGAAPDGTAPDGAAPDGTAPGGDTPDGAAPGGAVPRGAAGLPAARTPAATAPGAPVPGAPAPDGRTAAPTPPAPRDPHAPRASRGGVSAFGSLSKVMVVAFLRDRSALFFVVLFPLMFLVLFGTLFKSASSPHAKVAQVGPVAVVDSLKGPARDDLDKVFTVTRMPDEAEALRKVRKGDLDALIEQDGSGTVVLRFSAADQVRAGAVQGVVNALVQQANQDASGRPPAYRLRSAQVEDESIKAIQFFTPGLLGWAIATGAVFSAALTLVSWRKKRLLRRLRLAPVSAGAIVASRVGVSLLTGLVQTAIFISVATLPFFGLRLTGHWWLAVPLVVCGIIAFMSIGLVVGAVAKTEEAANGMAQSIVLPMSFLSGSFFSMDDAPSWLKGISEVLPLRHLVTSVQSVLTRGGGFGDALPTMGGLLLFAAVLTGIAWRLFSWEDA